MVAATARPTAEARIRAAHWFAEHGFGVFTVWSTEADGTCRCPKGAACENAGKHPIGRQGFHENTRDPERIRTLLSAGSEPNYGLVCPDGVFALDVDGDGIAKLAELEATLGPLPPTLRTATAHGYHIFLRWPAEFPRPIGQLWGFVTRWGSGQNAGYVIGPRSVHASGVEYAPEGVFEIAELPETWARSGVDRRTEADDAFIEIDGPGYQVPDFGYTGSRYDAILRFIASRYMRGIPKDEILAAVVRVLAPRFEHPLSESEIVTRFERAWRGTAQRLGPPLEFDEPSPAAVAHEVGWPAPLDAAAFHGPLGDVVRAVEARTEADPVGILATLLSSVGACMGHWRYLYQGSPQGTNVFTVLVGDSSSGRKGTAGSIAREVMSAAYPEWEKLVVAGLGSGEGLIAHLKRNEDTEHRALVMESEFGRLLTVMGREGSTLSPVVRDAWDGVPMGRFLAREQSLVTWHHVAIVAHVTPVELRVKLTDTDAANGFGNRFLWFAVRRTKLVPFPESPRGAVPPHVIEDLRGAILAAQTPAEIKWSRDAADRWEALYASLTSQSRYGLLGALAARGEAQIARLALLYALLDQASEIEVDHLAAAEAVWAYCERSLLYVFGQSTGNRDADTLLLYLVDGPLEWESAKRALGVRRAADMNDAVKLLESLRLVEVRTVARDGGGRPKRLIGKVEIGQQTEQTMRKTAPASSPEVA